MNNSSNYLTDYHQKRNKVVVQEVKDLSRHPTSLQAAIEQVQRLKRQSQSIGKKGESATKK